MKAQHHRITRHYHCDNASHRVDFEHCPHCEHRVDIRGWQALSTILVLDEVFCKHGALAIVAECPKCFEPSWVHHPIDSFYEFQGWPPEWIEAAQKEHDRRNVAAAREWATGLCGRCGLLEAGQMTTHAWRQCPLGSGPVRTECERFTPIPPVRA